MSSSTSSSSVHPLLGGAVILLICILLMEPALQRFVCARSGNWTLILQTLYRERLERAEEGCDVLFVGDSTARAALDPKQLERLSGLSAMNLGFVANAGVAADYYWLLEYLKKRDPPKVLVLGHMFTGPFPKFSPRVYMDYFLSLPESLLLFEAGWLSPMQAVEATLKSALPSYQHQAYIKAVLLPRLTFNQEVQNGQEKAQQTARARWARRSFMPYKGALLRPPMPPEGSEPISEVNLFYLGRLLNVLPPDTRVFWLPGPLDETVVKGRRWPQLKALSAQLQAQTGGRVELLVSRPIGVPTAGLADAIHANALGAKVATASVAAALIAKGVGSR